MRAVDEGLSTGAKLEVETIGAVSETSADVLEAGSNLACFSAGRRIRFFDLGVLASDALGSEGVGLSNRGAMAPTATNGSRSSGEDMCPPGRRATVPSPGTCVALPAFAALPPPRDWVRAASACSVPGEVSTRLGRMRPRGIEGDTTSTGERAAVVLNADIAIQLPFSATSGAGCALSPSRFCTSNIRPLGLAVLDGERRRYAFQRHPQIQSSVTTRL